MFYILHGDEEFLRAEEVAKAKAQIASDGLGDLNVISLDGRKLALQDLVSTCSTLPFLSTRRLVIVENLLQRFDTPVRARSTSAARRRAEPATGSDDEYDQKLVAYLPSIPPSTRLFFVETRPLNPANPILKYAQQTKDAYVREFRALEEEKLQAWLQQRAKNKGALLSREGMQTLIAYVGENLRLLDQELEKLAAYVGYGRTIGAEDVRMLVHSLQEESIFALVDALGARNRQQAVRFLQDRLAAEDNELYLLTMMARQFRLILAAKDLAQERKTPEEIGHELSIRHEFVVKKLLAQGQQFTLHELEAIQRRILEIDQSIKTGRSEGALALELFLVDVCRRSPTPGRTTHQDSKRSRTR
jgi:DNA polymerase III subunit delta